MTFKNSGDNQMDVSVIIVSYNTRDLTIDCIKSVYEQTNVIDFEILVVDNNSLDGSAKDISEKFPKVKLFALNENLGFGKSNNFASNFASGKYLLFLNPDTIVTENAIDNLVSFAKSNPKNKVYGGRTLNADMTLNPTSCWRKPSVWSMFCFSIGLSSFLRHSSIFNPEYYITWNRDSIREVDIVAGCLLMIEKNTWEDLHGFDEDFFMYGEDADICLRAVSLGASPIITPSATIIHYCGASEKVRADKMIRLFRAKKQLMVKHWDKRAACIGQALLTFSSLTRYLVCKILSFVNRESFEERSNVWRDIWHRRVEWKI